MASLGLTFDLHYWSYVSLLISHKIWYKACTINHAKSTYTKNHRNMEGLQSQLLQSCTHVRHRPADRQAVGEARPSALGLRALAGDPATVHSPQASQTSAAEGGCCANTSLAGDHRLLPREARLSRPGKRYLGLSVHDTSLPFVRRACPPISKTPPAPLSERSGHAPQ